jgi:uncharacterized YkwD family protein
MKGKKTISAICLAGLLTFGASAQSGVYIIQSGDTLNGICKKYEYSLNELLKCNPHITNPNVIKPGQNINVPITDSLSSVEAQVVKLVNAERGKRGLHMLTTAANVSNAARVKAQDMVNKKYFSHTSPTYGSPFNMMENMGIRFSAAGENIAMGQRSAQEVMTAWMNSPGHRANILNPSYTVIGVGAAKTSSGTLYWVQEFIKPM